MKPQKMRPLDYAARYGDPLICSLLVERGADVKALNAHGYTALTFAAMRGDVAIIEALVKHGADIDNPVDSSPLRAAVVNDHLAAVKLLCELGSNVGRCSGGQTLLHELPNNPEMAEYLVLKGIAINECNENGDTALDVARFNEFSNLSKKLVELGAVAFNSN